MLSHADLAKNIIFDLKFLTKDRKTKTSLSTNNLIMLPKF
jgi:hypothetical protein